MLLIVFLSKHFAVYVEAGVTTAGLPAALGGILVATIVLTPEGLAAIRAAADDNIQRSINICLGSGLATIGLTIPAVLGVSLVTGRAMELGLETQDIVILGITLLIYAILLGLFVVVLNAPLPQGNVSPFYDFSGFILKMNTNLQNLW